MRNQISANSYHTTDHNSLDGWSPVLLLEYNERKTTSSSSLIAVNTEAGAPIPSAGSDIQIESDKIAKLLNYI